MPANEPNQQLKIVILAAGEESAAAAPILLQDLGERKMVDYVVQSAQQLAEPQDITIVVGYHEDG